MKKVFERPASLRDVPTHYCSGCGHSIAHRLICEVIDELGIREDVIAVCPVGCAVIAYEYWDFDCSEAPHGRTPCVATGIKRVHPDKIVFSYQGDGDLAAIGTAEIIHTANRGENITVFFINNGVYGMTNGQMAPTTLIGQKTSTSIYGRDITRDGYPIRISELLSQLPGAKYIERVSVDNPANVLKTKAAIKKALKNQMEGKGFSLVEILSPCPTYWGLSPKDACRRIEDEMTKYFPLGVIKDI
ncbi:MAG: thiamine pyrophosphate-dependent enzyme [Candidatus Omnitrophica bacterium]|nr:thiamine pyrophosphate-dependent enzyme [Candidatus Omnitrophota bacterium]MDD5737228.1 thiamine pyrophosphate-dependent enzyme [Candidatus Omnitrophota bacterium]